MAQAFNGIDPGGKLQQTVDTRPMKSNPLEFMGLHLILQVNDDYLANDDIV